MDKMWKKTRGYLAIAMLIACGLWALSAMDFENEDPDLTQLACATLASIYFAAKKIEWE